MSCYIITITWCYLHLAQSLVTQALRDFSSPTVSLSSAQSLPSPPSLSTSSSTTSTPPSSSSLSSGGSGVTMSSAPFVSVPPLEA
jgi:hypothetical protein